MRHTLVFLLLPCLLFGIVVVVLAQQPPPRRLHKVIQKGELKPLPATSTPSPPSKVTLEIVGDQRIIRSNGIPNHRTGAFPNPGNPNRIAVQNHQYRVPAHPKIADTITPAGGEFGVAVNGVPFDPGAAEFYHGQQDWQYEPLSGAIALGIDVSHAHVQPGGKYHYHGLPTGLLESVKVQAGIHSPLIGWAADGFPIYAVYGFEDPRDAESPVQELTSSYQLKSGQRPGGNAPGGKYDGTFVADYQYVAGSGDLDQCNGRQTVTPEFPEGTYAYFLTRQWPVIPRYWRGTPSNDFHRGPGGVGRFVGGPRSQRESDRFGPTQPAAGRQIGPPRPGQVLPWFVRENLNLSDEQSQQLDDLQSLVDERLDQILNAEQREQLRNSQPLGGPPPGFGPPPGQRGFRRPGAGPPLQAAASGVNAKIKSDH